MWMYKLTDLTNFPGPDPLDPHFSMSEKFSEVSFPKTFGKK